METMTLDRSQWADYFKHLSKALIGKRAELEVASLSLGDQIEAEWLPFLGIAYDRKKDQIEILLEGVDHMISRPVQVYVAEGPGGLISIEIVDAKDTRQILKLRDPLMLPPPQRAAQQERRA
jgi:hypothetical protein